MTASFRRGVPVHEFSVVPFRPGIAFQEFQITLENEVYTVRARWNELSKVIDPDPTVDGDRGVGSWYMDLIDADFEPIFMGARIVLGVMLGRTSTHPLLNTGVFVAVDRSNERREATFEDLGERVQIRRYTIRQLWAAQGFFEDA